MDPWADPLGTGFHTIQGLLALGLGGITGSGLGESKLAGGLYLPNAWNDYIFAIIGEEFGFVGAGTGHRDCSCCSRTPESGRPFAPRIRSGRSSPRGSPPGCATRRSSTSASSWRWCR